MSNASTRARRPPAADATVDSPYGSDDTLDRLRAGDARTQRAVVELEQGLLVRLATRILGSTSQSETLVSDLFGDFFLRHTAGLRSARAIPAYLRIMTVRRARRLRQRLDRERPWSEADDAGAISEVDDSLDRDSYLVWLHRCLQKLTPRARTVLALHYGQELSYSEVGAHAGCTKQAVGKTVLKSLASLRECIEDQQEREHEGPGRRASP